MVSPLFASVSPSCFEITYTLENFMLQNDVGQARLHLYSAANVVLGSQKAHKVNVDTLLISSRSHLAKLCRICLRNEDFLLPRIVSTIALLRSMSIQGWCWYCDVQPGELSLNRHVSFCGS